MARKGKSYNIGGTDTIQIDRHGIGFYTFNNLWFGENFSMDGYAHHISIKYSPKTNKFLVYYDPQNSEYPIGKIAQHVSENALKSGVSFENIPKVEFRPYNWNNHKNKMRTEFGNKQEILVAKIKIEKARVELIENLSIYREGGLYDKEQYDILVSVKEKTEEEIEKLKETLVPINSIVNREEEKLTKDLKEEFIIEFIELAKVNGFIINKARFEQHQISEAFRTFPQWFIRVPHKKKETFLHAIEVLSYIKDINRNDVTPENIFEAFERHIDSHLYGEEKHYRDHAVLYLSYTDGLDVYKSFKLLVWGKPELSFQFEDDRYVFDQEILDKFRNLESVETSIMDEDTWESVIVTKSDIIEYLSHAFINKRKTSTKFNIKQE